MTTNQLIQHSPCTEGLEFLYSCGTLSHAWQSCERIDWLLWYLSLIPGTLKKLEEFCGHCVNEVRADLAAMNCPLNLRMHEAQDCISHHLQVMEAVRKQAAHISGRSQTRYVGQIACTIARKTVTLVGTGTVAGEYERNLCNYARQHFSDFSP